MTGGVPPLRRREHLSVGESHHVSRMLEPVRRPGSFKGGSIEGSPESRGGCDTGGSSGIHIVDRITNEGRSMGIGGKFCNRFVDRLGMGLWPRHVVGADQDINEVQQSHQFQAP